MGDGRDPMVGWRLWRLGDCELKSWGVPFVWNPGANRAECLTWGGGTGPHRAPGEGCGCGFWAVFDPMRCLRMVSEFSDGERIVMGLIEAWGEIALHGSEGFRAEHAVASCLFSDRIAMPRRQVHAAASVTEDREDLLAHVAERYGVPVMPVGVAARQGVLEEFGADPGVVPSVEAWKAGHLP
jgi:hypothetical protein